MKHLYKIMALFLLLAVAGGQCGFAQSYTVRVMSDTTVSICDSSIVWHGETITSSGNYEHLRDTVGDTIYVDSLHLTIKTPTSSEETVSECVSYEWHNSLYTTGGDYTWTTTGSNGCDSVVTLHLTIYYPAHSALSETSCGSFTWHGTTYTTSGDYTYSFQDANGCTQVDTLHLTVNPLPTPSIIGDTVICHGQTTTLTATGGVKYQWSSQASKISYSCAVTVSATGEYTVKVTDANECQKVAKTTVTVLPQFSAGSILSDDTVLCEGAHAAVTISQESAASGGDNKISYRWKRNNEVIPDSTNNTLNVYVNNLSSGTYLYTREAKDSACNTGWTASEGQFTIIIEAMPDVHIVASAGTVCHGEVATLFATGGASYRWSTSDTTQQITLTGDTTATYTVTATSIHNCSASDSLTITVLPTYNVKDTMTICESQLPYVWNGATFTAAGTKDAILPTVNGCDRVVTMTLMVNPTYNVTDTKTICASQLPYEWNGVTFATAGTKTTTLNTVNGCDSMVTMILTVNPTYNVTDTKTICASQLPHEWNGVTFAVAGTKNVTLQSVNDCDSVVSMTLMVNPTYNTPISESICQGQSYNFYGQILTTSGVYTHTLPTSKGCDSIITLTLTVNPLPTVTIVGESSFCQGEYVTLTASGANSYAWSNGNQNASITVNTVNAGSFPYTVTGTVNGCSDTATKTVTVNPTYATTVAVAICQGKSYDFFGQPLTAAGSYTHTLYTSKGCDSVITLTLTVHPLPNVTISGNDRFCFGENVTLTASDAAAYLWSNGDTTKTSIVNAAGTYRLTCTNQYGCTASADTVVTVDTLPVITIIGENQFCHGSNTVLKASGAGNYVWSTEEPSDSITVSSGGIYSVTGTDSHGCSASAALSVTENPLPNITIAGNSAFCQGDSITLTASGADSYSWSTGSVLSSTTIDEGGAYTVIGTNAYSCTATTSKTVSMNPLPTVSISGASSFCEGYSTSLTASAPTSCTYAWSQGANTATITVNNPAIYTVTATNANGCANTATQEVTETPTVAELVEATACEEYDWNGSVYNISGDYTKTLTAINGCDSIATLHLTINYGTHNVLSEIACESYTWHGTAYYTSGTYTFAYNNNFGCPSVDTLHLTVNYGTHNVETDTCCESYTWHGITYYTSGIYTYAYTNTLGCESMDTLHLTINNPTHTAIRVDTCDNFTWTEGTGQTYTTSGIYTYAHQDAHGCTQVDTLHLVINPSPTPFIFGDSSVCYGEVATLTAAGGETYQWSTEDVGNSIVVAMEGLYTVTATNMFGCSSTAEFTVSIAASPLAKKDIVGKSHTDGSYYMLIYPEADLQYQWYKNSVLIVGATKQYYYPSDYTLEGSLELDACYQVEVRPNDQDLCGIMTDCWEKPESMTEKIRILPNPNNGRFKLLLPEGTVDVQILNANGQLVLSRKTDGATELEMDTGLANGLYFVKTYRQDGSFNTEKLIINR